MQYRKRVLFSNFEPHFLA